MDNWHIDQLVGALGNGRGVSCPSRWLPALVISRFDALTVAVKNWENQGLTLE
jgi:hypothetical protein